MKFSVDLRPAEYAYAMSWHQFQSNWRRRLNDWIGWAILILAPIMIGLLAWQNALSIWFWPVAIVAVLYSLYSTIGMRYQIRQQATAVLAEQPALAHTAYHIHEKGIHLTSQAGKDGEPIKLFVPWKQVSLLQELESVYLIFVMPGKRGSEKKSATEDKDESPEEIAEMAQMLVLPKRSLPDEDAFRQMAVQVGVEHHW